MLFALTLPLALLLPPPTSSLAADITWRSTGPGGGGWIEAVACDPRDPDTLYLGCDVGGFYISRDAGRTWTIQSDGLTDYFVESIAVHPADSSIILLGMEGGVFRSTDQGRTWEWKRAGFPDPQRYSFSAPVGAVCFDPTRPEVAYAGIGRPRWSKDGAGLIYRSDDCGESWRVVTPEGALPGDAVVRDVEVSPDGRAILAATDRGVFRSDDQAATWSASGEGLGHGDVQELAFAPSNPQVVYCTLRTLARDDRPWDGGVWRSQDCGRTWQRRSDGLATRVGKAGEAEQMTSNCKEIVVDPRDEDVVYVGDRAWVSAGLYGTRDGGMTWGKVADHYTDRKNMEYGWITHWGPAVECLAISLAQPDRLVFGTSGHLFVTDDAAASWQQRYCRQFEDGRFAGNGLEVTCFNDCIPDPHDPNRLYFCYFDIGLLISDDRGASFRRSFEGLKDEGNCFAVAFDPDDRQKLWAATGQWGWNQGYVSRSTDRGKSWELVGQPETGLPNAQVRSLLVDPASQPGRRTLYATSSGNGVFRSDDDGATWRPVNEGMPEPARKQPCRLLMDPRDSKHLRVALGGNPPSGSGVYETRDGGLTWAAASRPGEATNVLADLQFLAADPRDFDTLYICQREKYDRSLEPPVLFPGGLLRSTDGGATWERLYDFHFTNCVAVSPANSNVLYLGTADHPYHDGCRAQGFLKSSDGGRTWTPENQGLTHGSISCIRVDPHAPRRLYIGTGGNGGFVGEDSAVP